MTYDWEKIFKEKTNKELYEVLIGKTILSSEAIPYAKSELEKRNFDFQNMTANKDAWELASLIEEDDYSELEISSSKFKYISFKKYLLIILGITVFLLFMDYYQNKKITTFYDMLPVFILIATVLVTLNNYIHKKQLKRQIERINRINVLKERLKSQNHLVKESAILKDLELNKLREVEGIKTGIYITICISGIMTLIVLVKIILNLIN